MVDVSAYRGWQIGVNPVAEWSVKRRRVATRGIEAQVPERGAGVVVVVGEAVVSLGADVELRATGAESSTSDLGFDKHGSSS